MTNIDDDELLRLCAQNWQNAQLWDEFYARFRRRILLYLLRAHRTMGGRPDDFFRCSEDWLQEFFTKLLQNDGRVLSSFRGNTENSAYAFLCTIALSIVADQLRLSGAMRRHAELISLDQIEISGLCCSDTRVPISVILELIDLERALLADETSKNPERDLLIFKLHFVEGLTAREIASIPALDLTTSGLEKVLNRVRSRLVREHA